MKVSVLLLLSVLYADGEIVIVGAGVVEGTGVVEGAGVAEGVGVFEGVGVVDFGHWSHQEKPSPVYGTVFVFIQSQCTWHFAS